LKTKNITFVVQLTRRVG